MRTHHKVYEESEWTEPITRQHGHVSDVSVLCQIPNVPSSGYGLNDFSWKLIGRCAHEHLYWWRRQKRQNGNACRKGTRPVSPRSSLNWEQSGDGVRDRELQTKQKPEGLCIHPAFPRWISQNVFFFFFNKFVCSQQDTFQTDLFEDAFNYCRVHNEESSPSFTHKLNCMYTPLLSSTSLLHIFPSIQSKF